MTELEVHGGGDVALGLGLPPLVLDLTKAWLWSYRSPHTREAYERNIRSWFRFCVETGLDPLEARKAHGDVYARWIEETSARPVKPKTLAQRLAAVSSWYDYLAGEDVIDANRFKNTRRPKVNKKHSETVALTQDEARALVREADRDHGGARLRTAALIRLLVQVGLRISEVVDADLTDLGFARGYRTLSVTQKGDTPLVRRLPTETTYALDVYLADRAERAGLDLADLRGPLVATSSGKALPREKAYELVKRVAKQAGIQAHVTPHTLRHTYASIAEEMGVPMRTIQLDLGHASVSTTEIYTEGRNRLEKDASQIVASAHTSHMYTPHHA